MKKAIGALGTFVVAFAMFLNTTNMNVDKTGDITLDSLIKLPTANAEDCYNSFNRCDNAYPSDYSLFAACMYGAGC